MARFPYSVLAQLIERSTALERNWRGGRRIRWAPAAARRCVCALLQRLYAMALERTDDPEERRRINRRLSQFERTNRLPVVLSYPTQVCFEATRRCNLSCFMCPHTFRPVDPSDLAPEMLDKVAEWLKACDCFWFSGLGETLTRPDFLQLLAKLPSWLPVGLYTNGTLLTEEICRALVERPVERLRVSIDSVDEDLYASIRGARLLGRVKENLLRVRRMKEAAGQTKPRVEITMTPMRRNVHELPALVEMAADLGASILSLSRFTAFRRDLAGESMWWQKARYNGIVRQAWEVADRRGIVLDYPQPFIEVDQTDLDREFERRDCLEPWTFLYVMNTGEVNGCSLSAPVLGDLRAQSMADIWNGPRFRAWRSFVNTRANTVEICACCPHWENQRFDNPRQMFVYLDEIKEWETFDPPDPRDGPEDQWSSS